MTDGENCDQIANARFAARPEELKSIRRLVRIAAPSCGFDTGMTEDIVLAVCEAVENVIQHAYGPDAKGDILLRFFRETGGMRIELQDFANRVNPDEVRPRPLDEIRPGGLGTHFIREIMDEAVMAPGPDMVGNLLTMRKHLEAPNMTVEVREERGVRIASLSGEIDLDEAPAVRAALLECAEDGGDVIVDLSAVSYIDSSGIASLVETLQKTQEKGGGLRLAAVSDQALRVLELAKLTMVFTIEESVETALNGLA